MKQYRLMFTATLILLFADVAADPQHPAAQKVAADTKPAVVAPQAALTELSQYYFAAARSGETAVLREFIQAGFPVDLKNDGSYTALMIAAYQGQASAVDLLLKAGADACIRDKRGHTALMGAMSKAEGQIAKQLYASDCDHDNTANATDAITDKSQMTAAQFAEKFGQSDKFKALATQLQDRGATAKSTTAAGQP